MLSHGHLIRRLAALADAVSDLEYLTDGPTVSWMPLYHIWGLGAAVLQPMYLNIDAIVLPTSTVIERPVRWLRAISRYRATSSGGPNFAFQACVDAVSVEEARTLDLRCWQIAPLGAETIRLETLDQFATRYEAVGFQRRAFAITYGLSEGMATVDARQTPDKPVYVRVDPTALEEGRVVNSSSAQAGQAIVSCGLPIPGQQVKIVDPEQKSELEEDRVGEIWLGGSLVADGYWNQAEQTEEVFHAQLSSGQGPFLRTGDLGFIHQGELYVTGRLKDMLIIHGKNLYAVDLEHTAEQAHPALVPTASIAFSVQVALEEQLVLVLEIRPEYETANVAEITAAVRRRIGDRFQLPVHAVVLVESGSLPRTQTGKLQRQRGRELYLSSSEASPRT
ncbi:hypothetical protein GCM10008957_36500 [Deinococcus ruber]|uniref:AMP-dependent synthetase/ligase domain-containing protein n=2 Tax=Deinococcus ruber TaxID=1848197 RepID=A0A918CE64_9DEIO|nr:hypothetical protein GCM10008957_36500 [Deinococcus ruber]